MQAVEQPRTRRVFSLGERKILVGAGDVICENLAHYFTYTHTIPRLLKSTTLGESYYKNYNILTPPKLTSQKLTHSS